MDLGAFIAGTLVAKPHELGSETGGRTIGEPLQDWARIKEAKRSNLAQEGLRAQEEKGRMERQQNEFTYSTIGRGVDAVMDYQSKLRQQQSSVSEELETALATEDEAAIARAQAKAQRFGVTFVPDEDEPAPQVAPEPAASATSPAASATSPAAGPAQAAQADAGQLKGLTMEQRDLARTASWAQPAQAAPTTGEPSSYGVTPAPTGEEARAAEAAPTETPAPTGPAPAEQPTPAVVPSDAAPQPAAARRSRSGHIVIDGKRVSRIDGDTLLPRQREVAAGAFAGVAQTARTPVETHAAQTAAAMAADLVGKVGLPKSIEMAEDARRGILAQAAAEERAKWAAQGQMARLAAQNAQRDYGHTQDLWKWAEDQAQTKIRQHGVDSLLEKKRAAESTIANIMRPNSVIQRNEIMHMVDTWIKGIPSDKDMALVMESGGKWNALKMQFNSWIAGGEIPVDWRQKILEAQELAKSFYDKKLHQIGLEAANATLARARLQSPENSDLLSAYAYDLVTGGNTAAEVHSDREKRAAQRQTPAKKSVATPQAKPAGQGATELSAEDKEILRLLGE